MEARSVKCGRAATGSVWRYCGSNRCTRVRGSHRAKRVSSRSDQRGCGWETTFRLRTTCAMSENGLITIRSQGSVEATIDSLEASLRDSGVDIFARIDH